VWLDGDLALLAGCDALLVAVSGYTLSTGTLAEIEFALERGIPVFYNIAELQQWGRERRG
jgi:nucleoside 2-deoxyribosyltransferase